MGAECTYKTIDTRQSASKGCGWGHEINQPRANTPSACVIKGEHFTEEHPPRSLPNLPL